MSRYVIARVLCFMYTLLNTNVNCIQALDTLGEEHRNIIAARLSEMCKRVDEHKQFKDAAEVELKKAREEAEAAKKDAKTGLVNVGMIKTPRILL